MRVLTTEEAEHAESMDLAVCLGEVSAALTHAQVTRQGTALERAQLIVTAANAGVAWAKRHNMQGATLGAVLAHARQWVSDRPGELADYDQRAAAFRSWVAKGE